MIQHPDACSKKFILSTTVLGSEAIYMCPLDRGHTLHSTPLCESHQDGRAERQDNRSMVSKINSIDRCQSKHSKYAADKRVTNTFM